MANLCITPSEFEARLGAYGHYCPVSLNKDGELVDCSKDSLELSAEFRAKYYKLGSVEQMKLFLGWLTLFFEMKCVSNVDRDRAVLAFVFLVFSIADVLQMGRAESV